MMTPNSAVAICNMTAGVPRNCVPLLIATIGKLVGAVGLRTYDPLIKSQLLYHLSYAP